MHKSQSPVSKKPFIKQPSTGQQKIHYNQLQLPTQLTSDQGMQLKTERSTGARQIKKNHLKQILVSNVGTQKYQNTHKPSQQSEHEQIKIVIPRIYQNGVLFQERHSQNQSVDQVINDLRMKIEELEGTVRHQDFKINRLQQELLFQRNQYNKLHNKYVQQEMKYNYYPQTCKLIKSSLAGSVEHISNVNSMLIPSLIKLQKGSSKSVHQQSEKIVTKLKQLKFNQQLLLDDLKQNQISQSLIIEVVQQVQEKAKELYEQKIKDLEELLKLQQIFFKDELLRLTNKYNVINIELTNIDILKEGYYEKVCTLLKNK
ncbi:hypothetical protein pb186bvf_013152 [Paramecium bursaria]